MEQPHDAQESPRRAPARRLSLRKKLVFSLVPLLILSVILEMGARLLGVPPFPEVPYMDTDNEMEWELRPNTVSRWGENQIEVLTNSLGYRDREIPIEKPDDEYRILFLGDSMIFGHELPVEDSIPDILERLLNESAGKKHNEVINAGVEAYGLYASYYNLREKGLRYDPDLLLVGFVLNDVYEPYTNTAHYGGRRLQFGGGETLQSFKEVYRHSRFFTWLEYQYLARVVAPGMNPEPYTLENMFKDPPPRPIDAAWDEALAQLLRIRELADENGVPMMVVSFPARYQVRQDPNWEKPTERLRVFCAEYQITCIDLLPVLLEQRDPASLYLLRKSGQYDEVHFSAEGNRVIAETIRAHVAGMVLLSE